MENLPNLDTLEWLRDTDETLAGTDPDIRGRKVVTVTGEELGYVSGLLIDQDVQKVRFMEVASGGFLGLGRDKVLIPIDAIHTLDDTTVRIDQTTDRIAAAPPYDPDLTDVPLPLAATYGYYGIIPYWGAGYPLPDNSDTEGAHTGEAR
jgi:sporulation protein YlmC with PRC-barrel domain